MSTEATAKGPPLFGLPLGGVLLGLLWVGAAFSTLFYCFATNYLKKVPVPAEELAIANAALAPAGAEAHRPPGAPALQP